MYYGHRTLQDPPSWNKVFFLNQDAILIKGKKETFHDDRRLNVYCSHFLHWTKKHSEFQNLIKNFTKIWLTEDLFAFFVRVPHCLCFIMEFLRNACWWEVFLESQNYLFKTCNLLIFLSYIDRSYRIMLK